MRWLRWIPAVGRLYNQIDQAGMARIIAEDRVTRADAIIQSLREDLREAIARSDKAHQTVANIFAQMHTGRKIFADAPGLGVDNRPDPPGYAVDRPATPIEAREAANRRFLEEGRQAYVARRRSS